jgi:hypothetical protein
LIFGDHPSILSLKEGAMEQWTRRRFLAGTAQAAGAAAMMGTSCGPRHSDDDRNDAFGDDGPVVVPLDGTWLAELGEMLS